MTNSPAADIILQIMAFENANEDCKRAIGTQKGKTDAMGYLRLCQGVGTGQFKATMLAQAITGFTKGKSSQASVIIVEKQGTLKGSAVRKVKTALNLKIPVPQGPKQPGICP